MTQTNNYAEAFYRELRKLKNVKDVDLKGILSGNSESYISFFRHLLCDNNLDFSRYLVEKGFDLCELGDYKFMEAIYRLMRELFNMKPPINQNQFFSSGFTQRKLEMSTALTFNVRKLSSELSCKASKKTVQTQSLLKSSLKRPNSAPKQRITEFGDEQPPDSSKTRSVSSYTTSTHNKTKKGRIPSNNFSKQPRQRHQQHSDAILKATKRYTNGDNGDIDSFNSTDRSDTGISSNSKDNNFLENHHQLLMDNPKTLVNNYHNYNSNFDNISAYDNGLSSALATHTYTRSSNANESPRDFYPYKTNGDNREKLYDVKQYEPMAKFPSSKTTSVLNDIKNSPSLESDKILQQLDIVMSRIKLLEGRMSRIESKLDSTSNEHNHQLSYGTHNQNNFNNSDILQNYNRHRQDSGGSAFSKGNTVEHPNTSNFQVIPDFETNMPPYKTKYDSDRLYSGHYYHRCTNNSAATDFSKDISQNNGTRVVSAVTNYSSKAAPTVPSSSTQKDGSFKANLSINKVLNSMPPLPPSTSKRHDELNPADENNKVGKQDTPGNIDNHFQYQTNRIASMISDTQRMLRISDEEL